MPLLDPGGRERRPDLLADLVEIAVGVAAALVAREEPRVAFDRRGRARRGAEERHERDEERAGTREPVRVYEATAGEHRGSEEGTAGVRGGPQGQVTAAPGVC